VTINYRLAPQSTWPSGIEDLLKGHSHISETYAVGTQDRSLSQPVLEFVRAHSGGT